MTRRHPPRLEAGDLARCTACGRGALEPVHHPPPDWPAYVMLVAMLAVVLLLA